MARFVYNKSKVQNGMDYLKEAKKKLDGITADINRGIKTIESANGYKYLSIDYSGMTKLEESAKEMVSSLEDLINEKIQKIEEYNAFRNEHPIKSKFYDFSMGATSIIHGIHDGAASIGDGGLAVAGAVGGIFSDTWKECCEETLVERKTKRDGWYEKQYSTGIWSDVEKYSSYSSKSTKANILKGVGGAVPFVAAAVGTGGAAAAGSISSTTALAADSTLAAYSALGDRTASGLVNGEDFDTAYGQGTKSAVVAGVSTFALGKGAEKLTSAAKATKGATNASDDVVKAASKSADDVSVASKNSSKTVFKNLSKMDKEAVNSADDLAKAVDDLKVAERNYQAGLKSGASDSEIIALSDARHAAKKEVQQLGGDVKKVLSATDKLDDAEQALAKARKGSSKATELDVTRLETAKDNANEIFKDANNFKKAASKSAEDLAKSKDALAQSAEDLRVAERNYQAGIKNNVSPEELEKLRADRFDARLAVQQNGGDINKITEAAKKLDDAEEALAKATSPGSKTSNIDVVKMETNRDTAKSVFNNVSKMDKEAAKSADDLAKAVDDLKVAERNYQAGLKSGASDSEIIALSDARHAAKKEVQQLGGDVKKVLSATDKLDDAEQALAKARKGSSKATELDVTRLETAKNNANEVFKDVNNFKKGVSKSTDDLAKAAEDLRVAERNYQAGIKNNVSPEELEKLRADRFDARYAVQQNGGDINKITEAAKKLDDAEEALAKATSPGSKTSNIDVVKMETNRDTARQIFTGSDAFNDAKVVGYDNYGNPVVDIFAKSEEKFNKSVKTLEETIASSGSGSTAKDLEEVGKYMYEADKKLNLARKAGASSAEIEELEIARDSAKKVFNNMGGNADFYMAESRIVDNAEENLAKAIKNGASKEEISLLREERDFARRMHSSSYGVADDVATQASKIDSIKSGIKNAGTNVKETVSTAAKNGAAKVSNTVKGATANISEAAAKAGAGIKSASTVFAENAAKAGTVARGVGVAAVKNPKVAAVTVGSAAAVAGSHVNPINRNTDLGGINIADVSDSVITAQAAEIFENRTVAREDEDKQPDNTTNTQDTGTQTGGNSSDNTGGSSNGSSKYASTIESRTSQATKDKTKKIIETITNKKTDKTTTQPTNNTVVNNVAPTQPANTNTNNTPNTPNTPIVTNNTNSTPTQQTVATVPTNTEVVAHQVNNNPEVSKTTYTGPTTVKGGSSTQSSYSNYGGSVNNNKSSIASVTKDVINKTKSAANTDIGSKVKSIIGDKKIDPIVIDDTTPSSTRRSGAGLAVSGVVAAGTALGIGTKVVLDKRKQSEEYDDEIEEITQDDGYDTDSAVYDNSKEDDSNIEMLYDDPYENDEGAAYDDSYDDIAYGETEDLVTF